MKKIIGWIAASIILGGAIVGVIRWQQNEMPEPQPLKEVHASSPPISPIEASPHYPIMDITHAQEPVDTIPALQDSDPALVRALSDLLTKKAVTAYFYPEKIVRHIVATIDNLPRQSLSVQILPIKLVGGKFLTVVGDQGLSIAPQNFERYTPYVRLIDMLDVQKLVSLYVHFYSLFQQAYQDLGYPDGYFNDRLIAVIDHLLLTPDYVGPVRLVQPKVFYQFADQELENASAGRKILIRIGTENATMIKKKLRAIRKELTGMNLK